MSPDPIAQADPLEVVADLPADAPRVGIIMAGQGDMAVMERAALVLDEHRITHEMRVMSAHHAPDLVADYCRNARMRGLLVIIAGAGLAAALPGAAAAHTDLPVIGVPLTCVTTAVGGLDAILACVQLPAGVPVATVGLDNPENAAHLAVRIIGTGAAPGAGPRTATI